MPAKSGNTGFENLENLQERLVFSLLPEIVSEEQNSGRVFCTCPTCLTDIAAIALNTLPSRYVADRFNMFGKTPDDEAKAREEAKKAIQQAIELVTSRPHHIA